MSTNWQRLSSLDMILALGFVLIGQPCFGDLEIEAKILLIRLERKSNSAAAKTF